MGKFRKGAKRPANAGRKPGMINKTTGVLREAVLLAAELEGDVSLQPLKKGTCGESEEEAAKRGGLVGYLRFLARKHPQAFTTLVYRRFLHAVCRRRRSLSDNDALAC